MHGIQPGHGRGTFALLGLGFAFRPWMVFDAAGGLAMVPGEDSWNATVGVTVNFGGA